MDSHDVRFRGFGEVQPCRCSERAESPSRIVEAELVGAAMSGDREALKHLLARIRGTLLGFAHTRCGAADAEDMVQETLIIVSRRIRTLRSSDAFLSWARSILVRQCQRRLHSVPALSSPLVAATIEAEHQAQPQIDFLCDFALAMNRLPAHHRRILCLRVIEGKTVAEISVATSRSHGATKAMLFRARQSLVGLLRQ